MSEDKYKKNITVVEAFCLVIIFLIIVSIYAWLDPNDMRRLGAFPWDSRVYRDLAEKINWNSHGISRLEGIYPFATRIFFPALYGYISLLFNLTFIEASYYLNLFSSLIVIIFTFIFLKKKFVPTSLTWISVCSYMLLWLGPIRYSGFYPGGGFAFESMIVCLLFLVLERSKKSGIINIALLAISVFFLALAREFVFYILLVITAIHYLTYILKMWSESREDLTFLKSVIRVYSSYRSPIVLTLLIASLTGYSLTRLMVKDTCGDYSVLKTVLTFGWFHLHIGEIIYPIFYALGPFAVCFFLAISFRRSRENLILVFFERLQNLDLVLAFCFVGFIFSMVGGADSDRFLLWFFPFYVFIALKSAQVFYSYATAHRKLSIAILAFSCLSWTRFYVPAIPHLFFPGNLYNSCGGVRSNLDPKLFYGPGFLEKYRFSLKEVPLSEAYEGVFHDNESDDARQSLPQISEFIERDGGSGSPYKGSYRYELNNIPFPFGFAHNQFELLVAHPYFGDGRVRMMLLIQWVGVYLVLFLLGKCGKELNRDALKPVQHKN